MGRLRLKEGSVFSKSFWNCNAIHIVLAILIVVMNLVSDILYKVIDPRITLE